MKARIVKYGLFYFEKQSQCFLQTAAPLSAYTARGLSHEGRYPLLSGLGWKVMFLTNLTD
jgi:hypothetical protein